MKRITMALILTLASLNSFGFADIANDLECGPKINKQAKNLQQKMEKAIEDQSISISNRYTLGFALVGVIKASDTCDKLGFHLQAVSETLDDLTD